MPKISAKFQGAYMVFQIETIPMTFSDLQIYSPTASLFKCDLSYICATADKISTDIARRASRGPSAVAEFLVRILSF